MKSNTPFGRTTAGLAYSPPCLNFPSRNASNFQNINNDTDATIKAIRPNLWCKSKRIDMFHDATIRCLWDKTFCNTSGNPRHTYYTRTLCCLARN